MPSYEKSAGTWKKVKLIYVRVAGVWTPIQAAWARVAGVWQYVYRNKIPITISADTANFNLFVAAGSPVTPVDVLCTVNTGVWVYSTSTATPAFDTGVFPPGSTLMLDLFGSIAGRGGLGGYGGSITAAPSHIPGAPGYVGGPALNVPAGALLSLAIKPGGLLAGGGGGGGGGAGSFSAAPASAGGGGGGGGQDGANAVAGGAGGTVAYGSAYVGFQGGTGTRTAGGTRGVPGDMSPYGVGGWGGLGGPWGTVGEAGTVGSGGSSSGNQAGGAPGAAANGWSRVTLTENHGTIAGATNP